ncbi:uncharacterized protein GGS22DRAFT_174145 [Annulohypoxylon maeteangense]|uniref:uncharacterized protein n=1 Tax=Annulohypoxylon maeteangense TaxID=1927788 RepID=UPI002008863F|nr:uncharacterized protein GGS22DRAFT_174145 [Annulohypoxylon maeteangense]KAI0880756.1 hypothetical protein GGS22DRAFT_174145 [Annulohypoxylon maeteangense]
MMTRNLLPRRIITNSTAGFRHITNCSPPTTARLSLAGIGDRGLLRCCNPTSTTLPIYKLLLRLNWVRRIHSNAATMSTTADSPSEASSSVAGPSVSKEPTTSPTTIAKEEEETEEKKKKLPPLKGAEFRAYNRLAEHMDVFHAHFRTSWNTLWAAACSSGGKGKGSRAGRGVVNDGLAFISQLEMHHNIEETYIFPILARRMPEFRTDGKGGKGAAELLRQHEEIHVGMEGMRKYLRGCRDGERELDMGVLKEQMQGWGAVLWKHLEQEVQTLGAENMRQYWSVEEIRRIPM